MKRRVYLVVISVLLLLVLPSNSALAFIDWSAPGVHVTMVEGTYMPNIIIFSVDGSTGSCAAGSLIEYDGQGADVATQQDNARAIFALLMAAKLSGQVVSLFGANPVNGGHCVVQFVHLGAQ